MPAPVALPSLEVLDHEDHTAVRIVGCNSLNEYNSHAASEQLYALAEEREGSHIVLDLGSIQYATSTALGTLVGLNRTLRAAGGRLVLINLNRPVAEALAITRLDRVLEIRACDMAC